MAAGVGSKRHAIGIAQSKGPHPRSRSARSCEVKKGIARQTVAGIGIDADDLAVVTIDKLSAIRAHVFFGRDDSIRKSLRPVRAAIGSAEVERDVACAVAA